MFLLVGPSGVGKTLLVKRLHHCSNKGSYSSVDDPPATIPTVGTNLINIQMGKKSEVTVRELGGSMGPIWHKYFADTAAVIYMIDLSNRTQVSAACIQLLDVLTSDQLQDKALLILLNKRDLQTCMSRVEFDNVMCLDGILHHAKQRIEVLEMSAKSGTGLSEVAKWIQQNRPH